MIINRGKFAQNGRCGYLLKPAYLLPSASPALPVDANAKATFAENSNRVRARMSQRSCEEDHIPMDEYRKPMIATLPHKNTK